jgi:hypothetical protein
MSKIINESTSIESTKMVEIKHTRTMQDASGNEVEVLDYSETISVEEALSQAESRKEILDSQVAEVTQEITDLIAIRDAE